MKRKHDSRTPGRLVVAVAIGAVLLAGVAAVRAAQEAARPTGPEMTEKLAPTASNADIVRHSLEARRTLRTMPSLIASFPSLDRARAYEIQLAGLKEREKTERRVGWKLAWSRAANPDDKLDPAFAYIMQSDVYPPGVPISARKFVGERAAIEAEVVVWITQDLRGPRVTREEVLAVAEVAPGIEFVASRLPGRSTREHAIVDVAYHAGVLLGGPRVKPSAVDFTTETGKVEINGQTKAEGFARSIMAKDPIEAAVWLANELIKYGQYLHAGDLVMSGTVLGPPPARAGDTVRVTFSTLGAVEFEMKP